jgi:hypothetical protein
LFLAAPRAAYCIAELPVSVFPGRLTPTVPARVEQ